VRELIDQYDCPKETADAYTSTFGADEVLEQALDGYTFKPSFVAKLHENKGDALVYTIENGPGVAEFYIAALKERLSSRDLVDDERASIQTALDAAYLATTDEPRFEEIRRLLIDAGARITVVPEPEGIALDLESELLNLLAEFEVLGDM
jgi:hypothetical protein